jgi:hypothetical protein
MFAGTNPESDAGTRLMMTSNSLPFAQHNEEFCGDDQDTHC